MLFRRIRYAILILICLILLLFYHDYFFFLLLSFVVLIPFLSYFSMKKVFSSLGVIVHVPDSRIEEGQPVTVEFEIKNPTYIPLPHIMISFGVENAFYPNDEIHYIKLPVHAKSSNTYQWKVTSLYAGKIRVCLKNMELFDLLGIFSKRKELKTHYSVLVFPKMVELASQFEERLSKVVQQQELNQSFYASENPAEIRDIREFRPGDRLQRIHWKLSTKTDTFYVKEYEKEQDQAITLYLEFYKDYEQMGYFNALLTVFYSSCVWLLDKKVSFYVQWYHFKQKKMNLQFVSNEQELEDVFSQLYELQPYQEDYFVYHAWKQNKTLCQNGGYYFAPLSFPFVHECEVMECYEDKVMVLWLKAE